MKSPPEPGKTARCGKRLIPICVIAEDCPSISMTV